MKKQSKTAGGTAGFSLSCLLFCVGSVLTRFGVLVIIQVDEAENMRYFAPGNRDSGPVLSFFPNRFGGEMNMEQWKRLMRYFSRSEKLLWGGSVGLILAAFFAV